MVLNELIKNYNYKLPEESVCGIYCQGYDFDILKEYLEKPFDGVFLSLMSTTVKEVSDFIPECQKYMTYDDKVIFLINIDEFNNDLQDLVSLVSSKLTLTFYEKLYSFIYEYQEAANALSDEEKEKVSNRIQNLYNFLGSDPMFICKSFHLPESKERDLIEGFIVEAKKFSYEAIKELGIEDEDINKIWKEQTEEIKYGSVYEKNIAGAWISMYPGRYIGDERYDN